MARKIDFNRPLNADEEQYVRERPWMLEQAESVGIEVTFESSDGKKTAAKKSAPEPEPEDDEAEDEDQEDEPEDYSDANAWTKRVLQAEIDRRNADYSDDEQIVPSGTKRDDLVAALLADDEELAAGEDDDEA